ncbi:MAG: BON domain-containing protein, partial [Planctomycetota bacterium]
ASVPTTQNRTFRGLSVQVTGRRAVLSGEVRSDSDRRMSELLLRLEPGISSVDNRVLVVP